VCGSNRLGHQRFTLSYLKAHHGVYVYKDLPSAVTWYEDVLGLPLTVDQGWSKIFR
jgi:hypothetical protein